MDYQSQLNLLYEDLSQALKAHTAAQADLWAAQQTLARTEEHIASLRRQHERLQREVMLLGGIDQAANAASLLPRAKLDQLLALRESCTIGPSDIQHLLEELEKEKP